MKIVNIEKQKAVVIGYFKIIEKCINIDKSYHFTKNEFYNMIIDSIFEKNTKNMCDLHPVLTILLDKLTDQEVNKAVYICQQIVQDVDYANNLFALSQKYRNLV